MCGLTALMRNPRLAAFTSTHHENSTTSPESNDYVCKETAVARTDSENNGESPVP